MSPVQTAATAGGTKEDTRGSGTKNGAPQASVPFIRASQEHLELAFDQTKTMTTSDQDFGVLDVPAYGYARALVLLVTSASGAGTGVTGHEDAPFNALKSISFAEPNGATILQVASGHSLYLINKYGGYKGFNDPRLNPSFLLSVGTNMNLGFLLRIPFEMNNRSGLGSLPNQNSGAMFKFRATLAAVGSVFAGTLTTPPTVRLRGFLEAWDQPEGASAGAVNQVTPPAMNTTQFWTEQIYNLNSGDVTNRLTRVGNYIRNLIFVNRRSSGSSRLNGDADWPDPATVYLDTRPQEIVHRDLWRARTYERYGYTGTAEAAGARDHGVYPLDYCHEFDGRVGNENNDLWLPTLSSTRLEIQGNFAQADTLTVLTNDVTVAGTVFM